MIAGRGLPKAPGSATRTTSRRRISSLIPNPAGHVLSGHPRIEPLFAPITMRCDPRLAPAFLGEAGMAPVGHPDHDWAQAQSPLVFPVASGALASSGLALLVASSLAVLRHGES